MNSAWIKYNPTSLKLEGVVWEEIDSSIKIDKELGEQFILGIEQLHNWVCKKDADSIKIVKKELQQSKLPSFWNLSAVFDRISGIPVALLDDSIIIDLSEGVVNAYFYATIKNDPTWLVKSWNLNSVERIDGIVTLSFKDTKKYSYYMDIDT